jgi:hypothetical protein
MKNLRFLPSQGLWRAALTLGLLLGTSACSGDSSSGNPALAPPGPPASAIHCSDTNAALSIRACGNRLVDAGGKAVQLRGVNVSGLEAVSILGWSPANPWGAQTGDPTPNWNTIKSWGANSVRLPLNEASWLGLSCVDKGGIGTVVTNSVKTPNAPGTVIKADPGGNYRATVNDTVASATAAGLYVIVDLHLTAPGNACPTTQNPMADADHSIAFWSSVAAAFKGYPNVMFELFNEPFLDQSSLVDKAPWPHLLAGNGTLSTYLVQGKPGVISEPWQNAGMQQMLNAVRATGATNVILTSTLAYSQAMGGWLQYHPTDTLNPSQIAAVWHAYPGIGYPSQASCIGLPACSAQSLRDVQAIMAADFPVLITEFGDVIGVSPPAWVSKLLPFADANGIGYLAWTWDVWPDQTANVLITNAAGSPTAGYGAYVKAHYLCRAMGTPNCP